jgi:protein TonB|nr:energy transducer TonB [Candidatus Krumholzibacteria bacterium]
MSTLSVNSGLRASANDDFKAQYNKYLRWSGIAALIIVAILWALFPDIKPNPYKLRQEEFEVVDIEDQEVIELPPPPVEAPPPPKVIEAAPDDEVTEDVEIADTLMDLDTAITSTTAQYDLGGDTGFVASSEKPKFKTRAKADYPEMARRAQIEGTVIVKVLVGPDGLVKDAQILQGVNPILDKQALIAARKWTFFPGKQRNIPVKAWMAIPFNFRLH